MPIYEFRCECGLEYEEKISILNYKIGMTIDCSCGKKAERLISDPMGFVRQEATTIGQLGERNFKALGKEKGEKYKADLKERQNHGLKEQGLLTKEQYKKARKLANLTPEQKRRYIQTGKLPPGK